jgi:hypothetical protein
VGGPEDFPRCSRIAFIENAYADEVNKLESIGQTIGASLEVEMDGPRVVPVLTFSALES